MNSGAIVRLKNFFFVGIVSLASAVANAGVIVVCGDEWPLSDHAFTHTNILSTQTYASNLASLLVGSSGSILNTSSIAQSEFGNHISGFGYTYAEDSSSTFDLSLISGYDAIMVGGARGASSISENLTTLLAYVNAGGSIYVFGGTGQAASAADEAANWNPFTTQFGITLGNSYIDPPAIVDVTTDPGTHPLRNGVNNLSYGYGHNVTVTGNAVVALSGGPELGQNIGMVATYEVVPEPASMAILGLGSLGLIRRRKR